VIGLYNLIDNVQGATRISALITFLFGMTGLFIILALEAAMSSSVLCQTLYYELLVDMILQKDSQKDRPRITSEILGSVSPKNLALYSSKMDFPIFFSTKHNNLITVHINVVTKTITTQQQINQNYANFISNIFHKRVNILTINKIIKRI